MSTQAFQQTDYRYATFEVYPRSEWTCRLGRHTILKVRALWGVDQGAAEHYAIGVRVSGFPRHLAQGRRTWLIGSVALVVVELSIGWDWTRDYHQIRLDRLARVGTPR